MRITRILAVFALLAASVLLFSYSASAKSDTEMAIALSKKLNELKMFDYSELVLDQELARNPADADMLKIQKGMTYFVSNKADNANKIISSITASSKYYPDSRRVLGIEALKKQKFDMSITALEDYFKVYLATPPTTEEGKKEFIEAANYLIYAYKQTSKVKEAEKAATYLDKLSAGGDDKNSDDRDTKIRQIQIKLDTVEEMIDKKQDGWKAYVNDSFKPIENLLWQMDAIAGLAYIEKARGLYFLDRIDEALKLLKDQNTANIINSKEINDAYAEQNMAQISPTVYYSFWLGKIYLKKAGAATTDPDKISLYTEAIQNFYKIIKEPKYEKFPRYDDALSGFSESKDKLEALGKSPKIPDAVLKKLSNKGGKKPGASLERKEADNYFSDQKYQQALALYLKAIMADRKSGDADIILARLASCYIKTNQALEAMAIATYLCDYYPASESTPTIMVQTGEIIWTAGTAKKDSKNKDDSKLADSLFEDAIIVYNNYLKNCPADQWAGDVSARIAKYYYNKAVELAKVANDLPQGDEKVKKAVEARNAFRTTAPYYQNIASNFAHTKWGISSIYSLAWCYTNAQDYVPGADNFLKYCDMEMEKEGDKDVGNVADAKMRAADNYIQYAKALDKEADTLRNKAFEMGLSGTPPAATPPALKKEEPVKKAAPKNEGASKEAKEVKEVINVDENTDAMTPVQLNAKADELGKQAIENYTIALTHLNELLNTWCGAGGALANSKDQKVQKVIESAYSLLGWAYDGAKDKENACKAFDSFIKKYPSSKLVPLSMLRMGLIYADMGKFDIAGQVLENLAEKFPQSPEGKSAFSTLARTMYEIKKFDKSIEVFGKIFAQNIELTPQDLRWACANLSDCDGTHPKAGAEMSVKAGEMLILKMDKMPPEDLIGKTRARETANNPKEQQKLIIAVKDKICFDYATACYWAGLFDKSLKTIDDLLVKENSAYYFDGRFLRALVYRGMKNYPKALENYGEITMTAMSAATKKPVFYSKAQCFMGDTFMEANDYKKAYAALNINAGSTPEDIKNSPAKVTKEEMQELLNWLEYAIYKAAYCSAKLGNSEERDKMVASYKKNFPDGKFAKDINSLPAADPAVQAGPATAPKADTGGAKTPPPPAPPAKAEAPKADTKAPAKTDDANKKK
ncbi:MAG: tetratricopeptide repeat protein [Victivallales bacterium]